jgi:hypothetical protein
MPSLLECILWASGDTPASCMVGLPRRRALELLHALPLPHGRTKPPSRRRHRALERVARSCAKSRRSSATAGFDAPTDELDAAAIQPRWSPKSSDSPPSRAAHRCLRRGVLHLRARPRYPLSCLGRRPAQGQRSGGRPLELVAWSASGGPRAVPTVGGAAPAAG